MIFVNVRGSQQGKRPQLVIHVGMHFFVTKAGASFCFATTGSVKNRMKVSVFEVKRCMDRLKKRNVG